MPRTLLGRGKRITAYETTLVFGSKREPWLVIMSDDAGIWPIEQHRTKGAAERSAGNWNHHEDMRARAVNAARRKKKQPPVDRELFKDFYVKKAEEFMT